MENEKKSNEVTFRKTQELDKQAEQMDDLMSQIQGPGYTAVLFRISPVWCEGFLEEIEVEPDSGFDMNYIIRKWGGKTINVKLRDSQGKFKRQATIKLKSFPPKNNGELLDPYDGMGALPEKIHGGRVRNAPPVPVPVVQQQTQPVQPQFDPNTFMREMMGMFKEMQQQTQSMQSQGPLLDGPKNVPEDPFGQLMAAVKTMKEMQKVFGTGQEMLDQGAAMGGDESNLFGTIMNVLGMMTKNQQPAQPQLPPIQAPPAQNRGPAIRNDMVPPPQPAPTAGAPDLPGVLAGLNPSQIGDIIVSAASRMTPEQREGAFSEVATRLAGLESVEYEDDDLSSEELDDVDESSTPPFEPNTD